MIDPITELILESERPNVLYHGSSKQNMKNIKASKGESTHDKGSKARVYAADTKIIASAFTFTWIDSMGITFGSYGNDRKTAKHILEIPKKHLHLIKKPCSLYTVSSEAFIPAVGGMRGEYYSTKNIKILNEVKYKTAELCMKNNGVILRVT